jgi:hypothetical protein
MTFTDFVGNPIEDGDYVVYSVKRGSSGVEAVLAKVVEVVEIIPSNPNDAADRYGQTLADRKTNNHRQIPGKWVTAPHLQGGYGDYLRDDSKAYVLKVNRLKDSTSGLYVVDTDKIVTIHNVANCIVVEPAEGVVEE